MRHRNLIALWTALALAAGTAGATTIQRVADRDLVARADLVAVVTVEAKLPYVARRPATDWLMRVDRVLKGDHDQGTLVVRLPGGMDPAGRTLRIHGAPDFQPGGEAIVFLLESKDGPWKLLDFPQGAFLAGRTRRHKVAVRDFSEVRLVDRGSVGKREPMRDFVLFGDWIEDIADGTRRSPNYLVEKRSSDLVAETRPFTVLESVTRQPFRWFVFDGGGSVTFRSSTDDFSGLPDGGVSAIEQALAAWTNEPNTPIQLRYGGTTSADGGHSESDRQNVVLWNDPNDEIAGSFNCAVGGTLAQGGPWAAEFQTAKGQSFLKIEEADIVVNDGIECVANFRPLAPYVAQLIAHELGHTLGLDHSSEQEDESDPLLRDALMYRSIHNDNRGAVLKADDVAGLRSLYDPTVPFRRTGAAAPATPPGTPPSGSCPGNTLCLLNGRFRVTGTWSNQFDGSSGTALPLRNSDLSGFFYFTDPANVELIVKILDFGGEIKVFYSQLTNLEFTLRVTDTATGRTKTYGNTSGDCGAIDPDFATSTVGTAEARGGVEARAAVTAGTCSPSATTLCLSDNRFAVNVDWRNQFSGASGAGAAGKLSRLTGSFSFDDPRNLEILIKILEFDGKVLVLWGSLSNFEYSIRITDTVSGAVRTFDNPAGRFCGGLDENAF